MVEKKEEQNILKKPVISTVEFLIYVIIIMGNIGIWIISPLFDTYISMKYFLVLLITTLIGGFLLKIVKPFPKEVEVPKTKINHFITFVYSIIDLINRKNPNQVPAQEFIDKLILCLSWKIKDLKNNDNLEKTEINKLEQVLRKKGMITDE